MLENIFKILGIIGFFVICIISFIIPNNPIEIIQTTNYSMPLFIDIIIIVSLLYWPIFMVYIH